LKILSRKLRLISTKKIIIPISKNTLKQYRKMALQKMLVISSILPMKRYCGLREVFRKFYDYLEKKHSSFLSQLYFGKKKRSNTLEPAHETQEEEMVG
jgi:hypothetical protein